MKTHRRFVVQVERNWAAEGAPANWQWSDVARRPKTLKQAREIHSDLYGYANFPHQKRIIVRTTRVTERVIK
jgi:hypothetical protein